MSVTCRNACGLILISWEHLWSYILNAAVRSRIDAKDAPPFGPPRRRGGEITTDSVFTITFRRELNGALFSISPPFAKWEITTNSIFIIVLRRGLKGWPSLSPPRRCGGGIRGGSIWLLMLILRPAFENSTGPCHAELIFR